jgi:hypothetical protein
VEVKLCTQPLMLWCYGYMAKDSRPVSVQYVTVFVHRRKVEGVTVGSTYGRGGATMTGSRTTEGSSIYGKSTHPLSLNGRDACGFGGVNVSCAAL